MSRRVYLLGVGLALVALALVITEAALGPPPGVTQPNVHRIRPGMTMQEVEALLGGPPALRLGRGAQWEGLDGVAVVFLDRDGRVVAAEFRPWEDGDGPAAPQAPAFFPRLRAWLGW
jgi:hypothetical protein